VSERGQKRRRLREQRRLREAMLLDLGALVYELHRQGRRAPELLQQKAAELTVVDDEVRELQAELDGIEAPAALADETADIDAVSDAEPPEDESEEEQDAPEDEDELEEPVGEPEDEHEPETEHDEAFAEHEEPRA
jgi:hypothetical protein